MMKRMISVLAAAFGMASVCCAAEILDECFQFQTFGNDCYENGDLLMEGECYALVWRHNDLANSIDGLFDAHGAPVDTNKCEILGVFNTAARGEYKGEVYAAATNSWIVLPSGHYSTHKDSGVYSVFVFDTRSWNGSKWVLGGKTSDTTVASLRRYGVVANLDDIKLGPGKNNPLNEFRGTFFSYNVAMYGTKGFVGNEEVYTSFGDYTVAFSCADTPVVGDVKPVPPGEDVDVPAGKTVQEFVDDINTNDAVKAQYLKAPGGVATTPAYRSYFGAVPAGDGKVAFELNEAGTNAVVAAQDEAKEEVLSNVLSATSSGELSVAKPIKGFYYCLAQQEELTSKAKPSVSEKLAGRDEVTFGLTKWTKSGFYQMRVSPKPVAGDIGSLGQ